MTHNAPERHRHDNQRHHHYARSPVRSYYGVARAASRYNALNVVGSALARLSPVPLRTTAHPHSSTIPQNIPQKGGHLSRSESARIKACRYDRLSPRTRTTTVVLSPCCNERSIAVHSVRPGAGHPQVTKDPLPT